MTFCQGFSGLCDLLKPCQLGLDLFSLNPQTPKPSHSLGSSTRLMTWRVIWS